MAQILNRSRTPFDDDDDFLDVNGTDNAQPGAYSDIFGTADATKPNQSHPIECHENSTTEPSSEFCTKCKKANEIKEQVWQRKSEDLYLLFKAELENAKRKFQDREKRLIKMIHNGKVSEAELAKKIKLLERRTEEEANSKVKWEEKENSLNHDARSLRKELDAKDKELQALRTKLDEAVERLGEKEREFEGVETKLEVKEKELKEAKIKLEAKTKELVETKTQLEGKEKEVKDWENNFEEIFKDLEESSMMIKIKENEFEATKSKLKAKEKELEVLRIAFEGKKKELEGWERTFLEGEGRQDATERKLEAMRREFKETMRELEETEKANLLLHQQNEALEAKVKELTKESETPTLKKFGIELAKGVTTQLLQKAMEKAQQKKLGK